MTSVARIALVMAMTASPTVAAAQPPAPPLTLDAAIQYAIDHYPTVRVAIEQVTASTADVTVARSTYLPRLDAVWQTNRGTANNIFGQLLPQSVIPSMSGPVLPSASSSSVWGSAVGGLASWQPFDFGLRHAGVVSAEAAVARARAGETLTRLDVASAVGAAYLDVLAAQRAVTSAQADLDRREVLRRTVRTLVDNQLRPGAEASRADAERAAAQTRLIRAQQGVAVAHAILMRLMGVTGAAMPVSDDALFAKMPEGGAGTAPASAHPLAQVQQAAIDQARAQEDVLARTDDPRVYLQSSLFARGSGANPNGLFGEGADGLGLERANWAAGVQVVLPNVFDFSTLRARKAAASASTRAASARYDEALLAVTGQQQTAAALLEAAHAVAANTPIELAAAQQTEAQARARYSAGLANIIEVADAQSLLAQAEVEDQLARVDVWRALLASSAAQGDLTPFLARVRQP
ncbi:MAG TPA: TolC family protein [Vicinamibacterales bacterium]|nr:TolC family protein [Vicinamibacterales bacterium]